MALADKPRPVIKKPKVFDPPKRQPPIFVDPPPRVKPRRNKELPEILDEVAPKRPRSAPAPPVTTLALRKRPRVRVVPA